MNKILKAKLLVPFGIYLITALPILYFILKFGVDVPYWDQWDYVKLFDHFSKGTLTFKELFVQQNEYRQLLPNLIFVLLGSLTNWDVRYEMIVIFLMASTISFFLWRLIEKTMFVTNWQKWFLFLLLNCLLFSPTQFENWLFGVQIVYYVPVLCFVAGLLLAFSKLKVGYKLLFCILLSVTSTLSSANGLVCWLLVFPILVYIDKDPIKLKRAAVVFIWIIAATLSIILYFFDYHQPDRHKSLFSAELDFTNVAGYFFNLMGSPFIGYPRYYITLIAGILLCISFLIILFYLSVNFRRENLIKKACPWVFLGGFSIANGVLITIGRANFGIIQSLSSRYITFTLFLIVAVGFLFSIILFDIKKEETQLNKIRSIFKIFTLAYFVLHIIAFGLTINRLENYAYTIRKAKAGLLFIEFVDHEKCKNKIFPANYLLLKNRAELLDSMNYIRPKLIRSNIIDEIELKTDQSFGTFDKIEKNSNSEWIASGFAKYRTGDFFADAIILTYENEKGESILLSLDNSGKESWTINLTSEIFANKRFKISAWIFDSEKGVAIRLNGNYDITG